MRSEINIGLAFQSVAEAHPGHPAIIFPDMEYSYDQLWQLTRAFATRMRAHGVDQTSTLYLDAKEMPVVISALLASALLGARFVQHGGDIDLGEVLQITHCFHTQDQANGRKENSILIDDSWSPADVAAGSAAFAGPVDADAPWLVVHTSGTTGYPKFLSLSQRMVYDRSMAVADEYGGGKTRLCILFPTTSRPFFARALGILLHGSALVDGRDSEFWQRAGVNMVSGSPVQAKAVFEGKTLNPKLPLIEVLGAKIETEVIQNLLGSFDVVDDTYGASETSKSFSNFLTLGADGAVSVRGQMRDSVIEIIDADGQRCAPGTSGRVRIRNPYMVTGYLNDEDAAERAFREGWFYPGDIASWGPHGELVVSHRDDDVINIGGFKLHGLAVDRVLKSVDGIADAICFKNPKEGAVDELFAFLVFEDGCNRLQAIASAKFHCGERFGDAMIPRVMREVAQVPRRPDGLPDREKCAQQVLAVSQRIAAEA